MVEGPHRAKLINGGAGICTYSVAVSKLARTRAFLVKLLTGKNFRRLHRFLGVPPYCPEIYRIRGGIVEATGARSRRSIVSRPSRCYGKLEPFSLRLPGTLEP